MTQKNTEKDVSDAKWLGLKGSTIHTHLLMERGKCKVNDMRLVDADALVAKMNLAIVMLKRTMKNFDIEDDPECQMELKAYQDIRDGIKEEPTIEPERKKGKWLPDNNNYYEERFICSVCGKSYKVDTCMGKPMWDFCPCGADMQEEGDNE